MNFAKAIAILAFLFAAAGHADENAGAATWKNASGESIAVSEAFAPPIVRKSVSIETTAAPNVRVGEVAVEVIVGMGGRAAVVGILHSTSRALEAAAIQAAEATEFEPARLDGKPIAVRYELRFERTGD